VLFSSVYVIYPYILELFGGKHRNFVVEHYREYVWLLDSIRVNELIANLTLNLKSFASTFPIIPTIVLTVFAVLLLIYTAKSQSYTKGKVWIDLVPYLLFAILYLTALALMGYYSRRLTLGLYIFLELLLIKLYIQILNGRFNKSNRALITLMLVLLVGSWVGTNGPLE
jgi:uncharacterized membrane protein YcfT